MKSILMKVNYDPRYVTPHRKTWQNPALVSRSTTLQPSAFGQPDGYTSLSSRLNAIRDIYLPPPDHQGICGSLEAAATRQLRQRQLRQVSREVSREVSSDSSLVIRALCRIQLLPVTHVLVLTVKLVYKLSSVPDDLKWATNTHVTPFTLTFKA